MAVRELSRDDRKSVEFSAELVKLYPSYNDRLLRWGSGQDMQTGHVVLFRVGESQRNRPESILGGLNINTVQLQERQITERELIVTKLKAEGKTVFDAPTYSMQSLEVGDEVKLQCIMGTYFDMLGSCTAMVDEFFKRETPTLSFNDLPLRAAAHQFGGDPVVDANTRSAAFGTSALLVFRDTKDNYGFVVPRRTMKMPVSPGKFHVVPSFMFQPKLEKKDPIKEFSVVQQVKAEYLEELFNMEGKIPRKSGLTGISSVPEGAYLERLLEDPKRAQLLLTGIAFDLATLRPEISTVLLIHDPECSDKVKGTKDHKPINLNWEISLGSEFPFGEKGVIPFNAPLIDTLGPLSNMVQVGAGAIRMGLDVAREEMAKQGYLRE